MNNIIIILIPIFKYRLSYYSQLKISYFNVYYYNFFKLYAVTIIFLITALTSSMRVKIRTYRIYRIIYIANLLHALSKYIPGISNS